MKIKNLILCSLLIPMSVLGSFKENPTLRTPDLNKLKLNQEVYLTDTSGVVNIKTVSLLQVGDNIRIYRTDGTLYTGIVTKTEESNGLLQIIGNINNVEETQFGFVFVQGGHFAGAIVEKKNDKIYALQLSEAHKGFVFLYTTKYDKKLI